MNKQGGSVVFVCLLAIAGCSGSAYPVSTVEGTIAVDGVPLDEGSLSFSPLESNAGQAISAEIKAGKYRSDKVPRGKSLVIVSSFKDIGEKHVEFGITYPKLKNMVPEKYQAGIELNVDAPKVTHNFELTTK